MIIATPYAGITRVRFKGYNLSRISIPFQNIITEKKQTDSGTPLRQLIIITIKKQFFSCFEWKEGSRCNILSAKSKLRKSLRMFLVF